ncbi:hypothetical protein P5V15_013240 [Pogonomyrmex californicus]
MRGLCVGELWNIVGLLSTGALNSNTKFIKKIFIKKRCKNRLYKYKDAEEFEAIFFYSSKPDGPGSMIEQGTTSVHTADYFLSTETTIAATKIETRERGALSPLASSKDAAPRREHENSARENTGFPSGYHQRQQHRNDHRE